MAEPPVIKSEFSEVKQEPGVSSAGIASTPASANVDRSSLAAVIQFLRKNNLKGTEQLLLQEARVSEDEVSSEAVTKADVTEALVHYKTDGDPSLYENQYKKLEEFIEKAMDLHKCELSAVLYPIFVHMYLQLIYNNHVDRAEMFFARFSGDQEYYFQDSIRELHTVKKREHMRGNQLLENFETGKFVIRMSRDSYNHLKRFLLENKHNVLLTIVQQHLFTDVFDGLPRNQKQIEASSGGMLGEAKKEANKQKIYFGLLKEPDVVMPMDEDDEEEGEKPKRKKPKKENTALKKGKVDPNAPPQARIPLPEWKDSDKLEKMKAIKESRKRVDLGSESLPTVCFYTVLNANKGVCSIDSSADSSLLATGFANAQITVDSLTGDKLRVMKQPHELELLDRDADDLAARIWDYKTASDCKTLRGHQGAVYSCSFQPDRTMMVSASQDSTVRLWSTHTWTNVVSFKGHINPVWDVKFGPYGYYFVSGGSDRMGRLWATAHPQPVRLFAGHLADIDSVEFHPNSNYVVTGSSDRTIRMWDVLSGNCVRILTGHKGPVQKLAFSPDGKYLASAGADKTVLLWDVAHGDLVGHLQTHKDTVCSLAFSRDGTILASGGLDNCVKLWDLNQILEPQESDSVPGFTNPSSFELKSLYTKKTPVLHLQFTRRNVLIASGPYDQ